MNANSNKIPKVIHYCWFGAKEKPEIVEKCLKSWQRYLLDYQLMEWNEFNFDLNSNIYIREAFEAGKFAFVSDYVRLYALYNYGGIYLDTDVEVFKPFDDLLHHHSFWGFEQEYFIATSTIGAEQGNKIIKLFLDSYNSKSFINSEGKYDELTNVAIITEILKQHGLKTTGEYQEIEGLGVFYPQTFFSPYDYINCRKFITQDTYTIHYFYKSWLPPLARIKGQIKFAVSLILGGDNIAKIRNIISKTWG